jgi:hypothetical protein
MNCKKSLKKASGYILLEPDGENTKYHIIFIPNHHKYSDMAYKPNDT